MSDWHTGRLSTGQAAWVESRVGRPVLRRDMSWNLVDSVVLHVRSGSEDLVVKAGGTGNHHIGREIAAHDGWTSALTRTGHAARLLAASADENVMLLEYLPGRLVEGTDAEWHPSVHQDAGVLLRRLHAQERREDAEYEARVNARALRWLDGRHRVDADTASRARGILQADAAPPVVVVPTHGDWQPRNWLIDGGRVRVIDFGRFAFRPASSDLTRLAAQQWRRRPELQAAFFDGYGDDPRDPDRGRMEALREAVGTACWAFQVGDEAFEAQGHRMLADALAAF